MADEFVEVLLSKPAWRQRSNVLFDARQVAIVDGIETRFECIYMIDFFKRLALFKFDNRRQDVSILTDGVIVERNDLFFTSRNNFVVVGPFEMVPREFLGFSEVLIDRMRVWIANIKIPRYPRLAPQFLRALIKGLESNRVQCPMFRVLILGVSHVHPSVAIEFSDGGLYGH